ncbi:helix-turn-helix domain-containing protein [Streptomyces sp. NPDC055254]
MGRTDELQPHQIEDVAEFLAALRQLKVHSGLTYRQLEEQAAARDEVLARSTLADVLGGKTAPRPELLAAFIRACGDGERVAEWLQAWNAVTGREGGAGPVSGIPAGRAFSHPSKALSRKGWILSLSGLLLSVMVGTAWVWIPSGDPDSGKGARGQASASPSVWPSLPGGRVHIRPGSAETLCLTDGRVAGYDPLVAVQRPCDEVAPQKTVLEPLGGSTYRITWHHPGLGKGCLKALTAKPATGLLEPWGACEQSSRFRIEPSGPGGSNRYLIRVDGEGCVGIKDSATSAGIEARVETCRETRSQMFIIEPAP